jgi:hypothetical protein
MRGSSELQFHKTRCSCLLWQLAMSGCGCGYSSYNLCSNSSRIITIGSTTRAGALSGITTVIGITTSIGTRITICCRGVRVRAYDVQVYDSVLQHVQSIQMLASQTAMPAMVGYTGMKLKLAVMVADLQVEVSGPTHRQGWEMS